MLFMGFSRLDVAEGKKITECEDMQIKVSQTENRRGKKIERNGTEYPRTVKQLQKL